jgi:membrane protein DedA with SNARE-associated domain
VAAGAAIASHTLSLAGVLFAALSALLLGDIWQFWLGRYTGWALLGFLCRLSMNPETCILRSAESFYKRGKTTLIVAKFIPGINTMAAPLAGSMKMPFVQFLRLDVAGSLLYTVTYLLIGYLSRGFLVAVLKSFYTAGRVMEWALGVAVVVYVVYRIMQYQKYREYEFVPRVQAEELAERLTAGEADRILIVDVRSHGYYDAGAERIIGSIRRDQESPQRKGHISLLYLSARSDQRPGGASTAGQRIQHVRDRRRPHCLAQGRGPSRVGAQERSGAAPDFQLSCPPLHYAPNCRRW